MTSTTSRIDSIFADLRAQDRTALMPFLTAGYPSLDVTEAAIPALAEAGASIIELGIPFSDPIADGPVIAASMYDALQSGVTPEAVFDMVRRVRPTTEVGLIAMVSASIVHRYGVETFLDAAADAGIDGVIIPDIDTASALPIRDAASARGLSFSLLVAPNSAPERMRSVVEACTGFVYVLARLGLTGEQSDMPDVARHVATIRELTDLPLAVGFGISSPEHVAAVTGAADAAIVGSALVRRMGDASDPVDEAQSFVRHLANGLQTG